MNGCEELGGWGKKRRRIVVGEMGSGMGAVGQWSRRSGRERLFCCPLLPVLPHSNPLPLPLLQAPRTSRLHPSPPNLFMASGGRPGVSIAHEALLCCPCPPTRPLHRQRAGQGETRPGPSLEQGRRLSFPLWERLEGGRGFWFR